MNVRALKIQVRLGAITLKLPNMVRISGVIIIYLHEYIPQCVIFDKHIQDLEYQNTYTCVYTRYMRIYTLHASFT